MVIENMESINETVLKSLSQVEPLKSKIVKVIGSAMKNQSKCDFINLDNSEVKKMLLQNEGEFRLKGNSSKRDGIVDRIIVKVSWNKEKMFFNCSVAFLKKQKNGSWKCIMRFDDCHECRHADVDLPIGKTKMIDGQFALIKVECPILSQIINSLPEDRANTWKIKLFEEILIGNQKRKEHLNNPKIHFY